MKAIQAQNIRTMTSWQWLLLFGFTLAAWVVPFLMAMPADLSAAQAINGDGIWRDLRTLFPDTAGLFRILLMLVLIAGTGLMLHNSCTKGEINGT